MTTTPPKLPHGFAVRGSGGVWYDANVFDDDHIGLVVGDCVSRRFPAAAVMGHLRSPGRALDAFDELTRDTPTVTGTSALCAVVDPAASVVSYSSAGHPPPLLLGSNGELRFLDKAQGPPLGAGDHPRAQAVNALPAGSTLVIYTQSLAEGIRRVAGELREHRQLHPAEVASRLMAGLASLGTQVGDSGLLLYRQFPEPLRMSVPALPNSLATIRARLREWLPRAAVTSDTAQQVLVAVGEAATNAIEHATRDASHPVELAVSAETSRRGLALTVADNGRWRPPPVSTGNRGHGINVMNALVGGVSIYPTDHGTTVEMVKELT